MDIATMDDTGHTRTEWDKTNADEVDNARKVFKRLKKRGFLIYRVGPDGENAEMMLEFDPKAEKMLAHSAMTGG